MVYDKILWSQGKEDTERTSFRAGTKLKNRFLSSFVRSFLIVINIENSKNQESITINENRFMAQDL